jgi:phospholipase/carboxylesterase/glyoxalase family protein
MSRFFRRFEEGVFDIEDLIKQTHDLAEFISSAALDHGRDPDKLIAVGYSNGANIAASLLLLRPEVLRAAVLYRPMVPLCPARRPNLDGVNVLVCAGKHDEIVAPEEPTHLAELLHESRATVSLHWSDSGHGLSGTDVAAAQNWLEAKQRGQSL